MATWTQIAYDSGWGKEYHPTCDIDERNAINIAFNDIISNPRMMILGRLRDDLQNLWEKTEINCKPRDGYPPNSVIPGSKNGNLYLEVTGVGNPDFQVNLLRILVEWLTNGKGLSVQILDVEAAEHACFENQGATLPTVNQLNTMRNNGPQVLDGEYCVWNRQTGEIFDKVVTGGGWGGTTTSQGTLCFQHNGFIH